MENSTFPRMHVSLYVSDILETISFYNLFFGKTPDKIRKGYIKYILDQPSLIISFVENPARVQQNFGHLGFQVSSIEEMQERMAQAQKFGLATREEIGTNCCFAKQDKFWVNDPDGVQWEVYYFHEDAEFNDPHYEEEATSACCIAPGDELKPTVEMVNLATVQSCSPGSGCC